MRLLKYFLWQQSQLLYQQSFSKQNKANTEEFKKVTVCPLCNTYMIAIKATAEA